MNIFTATMPIWIGVLIIAALVALVLYFAFVAARNHSVMESLAVSKQNRIHDVLCENDKLKTENANLSEALEKTRVLYNNILAQNADLREALQEAQAEIKALQMNTIEVPEVTAPLSYAEAKPAIEQAAATSKPRRSKKAGA